MQFLCCMNLVIVFLCRYYACNYLLMLEITHLLRCFLCSFDQFNKPGCINPDVQRQTMEALLASATPAVENCMRPEFIRLAPPLHIAEDEVFKTHISWWAPQPNLLSEIKTNMFLKCIKTVKNVVIISWCGWIHLSPTITSRGTPVCAWVIQQEPRSGGWCSKRSKDRLYCNNNNNSYPSWTKTQNSFITLAWLQRRYESTPIMYQNRNKFSYVSR